MLGFQHKRFSTGVHLLVAPLLMGRYKPPMLVLVLSTLVCFFLGSIFPDIDHPKTKLGKAKNLTMALLTFIPIFALVVLMALLYMNIITLEVLSNFSVFLFPLVCLLVFDLIMRLKPVQNAMAHRGIMHSLIVVILFIVIMYTTKNVIIYSFAFGLASGCLSHFIADSFTVGGWKPLWKLGPTIHLARFPSNSQALTNIATAMLFIGIIGCIAELYFKVRI